LQDAEDELGTHLQAELGNLPPEEREIVERKYFGEQSVRDIAAELQTTEKAVESRLLRARRRLKEAVLGRLQQESATGE
jgi:RNA polymerase sigma factor (sigma-70 family)